LHLGGCSAVKRFANAGDFIGSTDAYERTLRMLSMVDRSDPITQLIAKKIIELGQRGVREAKKLSEMAVKELEVE
jgi:hypothetical protein